LFILCFATMDIFVSLYDRSFEDVEESKDHRKGKDNQAYGSCYCPE